jgi:hypothetical protein
MDNTSQPGLQSPVPPVLHERERSIGRIGRGIVAVSLAAFALVALFKPG